MHLALRLATTILALSSADPPITMTTDSLQISLEVPEVVAAGKPVPIVIRLENAGGHPLDLYLRGRTIVFDIFIAEPTVSRCGRG